MQWQPSSHLACRGGDVSQSWCMHRRAELDGLGVGLNGNGYDATVAPGVQALLFSCMGARRPSVASSLTHSASFSGRSCRHVGALNRLDPLSVAAAPNSPSATRLDASAAPSSAPARRIHPGACATRWPPLHSPPWKAKRNSSGESRVPFPRPTPPKRMSD